MGFLNKLKDALSDEKFGKASDQLLFQSGVDAIDFLGSKAVANSGNNGYTIRRGLWTNNMCGVIGRSGTAKSTFILQTTWEVCKKYEDSSIIWLDFENSLKPERIFALTGVNPADNPKFDYRNTGISIESVFELLTELRKQKLEYYSDPRNLVPNQEGIIDDKTGELKRIMPPTFVVLDSIRAMTSTKVKLGDEKSNEMNENNLLAAQIALRLGQLARQAMQICAEANIVIPYVNHIQTKINTSFTPQPKDHNYLKQNESLPGGDALLYYTTTLIKLIAKGNLDPMDQKNQFGVKGFELEAFLIKSRDTAAGQGVDLVFDQNYGFDNDLCNYYTLENAKKIQSAGAYKKLDGYAKNWRARDFKDLLQTDAEFKAAFDKAVRETYDGMVYVPKKLFDVNAPEVNVEAQTDMLLETPDNN